VSKPKSTAPSAKLSTAEKCLFTKAGVQAVRIEASTEDSKRFSNEQEDRKKQLKLADRQNWITGIGAGISFLALVFLFGGLLLNKTSTDAAVSQAKTAQSEFVSSQRPWVSLEVVEVGKLYLRGNLLFIEPAIYIAKNHGHSVAETVSFHGFIVMNDKENGRECDDAVDGARESQGGGYPDGTIIFPDDTVKAQFDAHDYTTGGLDHEFQTSPSPGQITPRLVACVVYTSPLDKSAHYTRVVYWIYHKGTRNINFSRDAESYDIDIHADFNGSTAN